MLKNTLSAVKQCKTAHVKEAAWPIMHTYTAVPAMDHQLCADIPAMPTYWQTSQRLFYDCMCLCRLQLRKIVGKEEQMHKHVARVDHSSQAMYARLHDMHGSLKAAEDHSMRLEAKLQTMQQELVRPSRKQSFIWLFALVISSLCEHLRGKACNGLSHHWCVVGPRHWCRCSTEGGAWGRDSVL